MSEHKEHYARLSPGAINAIPATMKRYHDFGHRSREEILLAYLSCFSSPAGQIVMDDLYQSICGRQMVGERDIGKHDIWIYFLDALQEAERLLKQRKTTQEYLE